MAQTKTYNHIFTQKSFKNNYILNESFCKNTEF